MDRLKIIAAVGLVGAGVSLVAAQRGAVAQRRATGHGTAREAPPAQAARRPARPTTITAPWPGFVPARARRGPDGRLVADLPGGARATLTLEPAWQRATQALLARHAMPAASVVVLDTATGRVLVYASRGAGDLAVSPDAPAASVFKIVTASALLAHGMREDEATCYSGGYHALRARDLVSDPRRDRECVTLGEAFARSINTVFARRALEHLRPDDELAQARRWGFGGEVPFDVRVAPSDVTIPTETLPFAQTAAGFWRTHLSPLHGALLAQGIALGGEMQRPWLIERVQDARGAVVAVGAARPWQRAVSPEVAAALGRMMRRTVTDGTGQQAFHDPAGREYLPGVIVGGKTGTLTAAQPYRAYTWFVGNAEGPGRRLSFGVVVANGPLWRVKAATLARQVLQIAYRGAATD